LSHILVDDYIFINNTLTIAIINVSNYIITQPLVNQVEEQTKFLTMI